MMGSSCEIVTQSKLSQRVGLSWTCGLVSAAWDLCALCVLAFVAYACWTVRNFKEELLQREGSRLLLERAAVHDEKLRRKLAEEDGGRSAAPRSADPTTWAVPQPGMQPPWGSVHIRSAAAT
mmetsp:Transcript_100413/g.322054  ORF Transcript_100413/g.322054 Transcript_100413/m.322054 type:complete len:122 (+) Transcript_100413:367-732(+)